MKFLVKYCISIVLFLVEGIFLNEGKFLNVNCKSLLLKELDYLWKGMGLFICCVIIGE